MKYNSLIIALFVLLFSLTAFAQSDDSTIIIKVNKDKYVVSGIVNSDSVKSEVEEKTRAILGNNADFSQLKVQLGAEPFQYSWQSEFEASLKKIKTWKSGIFVFSIDNYNENNPLIPVEIAESQIKLDDGKTIAIKDFNNKTVVLFLIESWCSPCRPQAEVLRDFYPQIASSNMEIIALSSETAPEDRKSLREQFDRLKIPFTIGWTDLQLFANFVKISNLDGIPQVFIIKNGKLRGVFMGAGSKANRKLKEALLKIANENNLSK